MAKKKCGLVSNWGTLFKIGRAIVHEILNLGGKEEDIARVLSVEGLAKRIAQIIVKAGRGVTKAVSSLLPLDRSVPFDPVKFLGKGWSIAEQDPRSLTLTKIDLSKIALVTTLKKGERWVTGAENLCRLKATGSSANRPRCSPSKSFDLVPRVFLPLTLGTDFQLPHSFSLNKRNSGCGVFYLIYLPLAVGEYARHGVALESGVYAKKTAPIAIGAVFLF